MAVLVSKDKNRAVFTAEITQEEFKKACQDAYNKNKKQFSMPGFRKGKVPRKILEAHYGEEIFFEDAVNILLPDTYAGAVEELEISPVANPSIDIEEIDKEKPVKIKFEVDIKPEFELGDYKNLKAEVSNYDVTDEVIDQKISSELEANARLVNVDDREAKDGDIVHIDFLGTVDGEEFEGGKAENYELILGSNTFIPGFENQIIGNKVNNSFDVDVTFPKDYHEDSLADKDAVFKVTLNSIQERVLPTLDDEFVKDVSEFDTLSEYKKDIQEQLEKTAKEQQDIEQQNKAVEALIDVTEFDIPESMLDEEIDKEFKDVEYRVSSMGINMEQYYMFTNTDEKMLRDQLRETANTRVRGDLVLEKLIEVEKIEATEEELKEELNKLAEQYSKNDKEKFIENLRASGNLNFIEDDIKKKKTVRLLQELTEFSEVNDEKNSEK